MPTPELIFGHPDAPPKGFTIRSDGSVLLSPDVPSYNGDLLAKSYATWLVMKKDGFFDGQEDVAKGGDVAKGDAATASSQELFTSEKKNTENNKGKGDN